MNRTRARLAALAAAAGYGPEALSLVAEAALPHYQVGERLDLESLDHVASAVEVLAQAGQGSESLADVMAHYRDRYGERSWRVEFWHRQLRTAVLRFNHPRFYGLSPCEADPARLAAFEQPMRDELPRAPLADAA